MSNEGSEISRWLCGFIGPGRPYRSPRALALAAGLSQNTVGNIIDTGAGDAASIGKLADLLGVARPRAFVMAGWLMPTEVVGAPTEKEAKLLLDFSDLPANRRNLLLEVLAGMREPAIPPSESPEPTQ